MVCDEKRGTLRRKEGDANEKQALKGRMNRGRPKRRWLDKVKDGIKEKRLSAVMMCLTVLHGRRMSSYTFSTPHKSGNTMKEKKKEEW